MSQAGEDRGRVHYSFDTDGDLWERWTNSFPRSTSIDDRIQKLIEKDADGDLDL